MFCFLLGGFCLFFKYIKIFDHYSALIFSVQDYGLNATRVLFCCGENDQCVYIIFEVSESYLL